MTVWHKRRSTNSTIPFSWSEANRPTSDLDDGLTGFNTDVNGLEVYLEASEKWLIMSGSWTVATRPTTTALATGSQGFNSDTGFGTEFWDGTNWRSIG